MLGDPPALPAPSWASVPAAGGELCWVCRVTQEMNAAEGLISTQPSGVGRGFSPRREAKAMLQEEMCAQRCAQAKRSADGAASSQQDSKR